MGARGRPPSFKQEVADAICERLANGDALVRICELEGMPTTTTVRKWLVEGARADAPKHLKDFLANYTRAREEQADAIFDECLAIADNATDDVLFLTEESSDGEGARPAIKHSAIQRAKLQIDTRKWMAAKLRPKKYGERMQVAGDPDAPIKTENVTLTLTSEDAYKRMLNGDVE